ncbi:MAG: iron-sulfur cluster assembly accessory protein [Candidatus Pristimantibacillus lignocellulolyticus]|uniref:Iron-sulfur cluster assembly accessory protein n=1 Tax=Candidatus Pristimantibacillus lignocellulolyticus TaxID=2994561 RepID=A0A9J6Z970_9BACL|nr:MAG: iron-sulfur cluster assembly accessory protein [Candidatus Pristimantibacillus lignocellulolyticus]
MIEVSDKASSIIDQMISENGDTNLFLRVGIDDGGCSGLSYNIKLDNSLSEFDKFIQNDNFKVVWDTRTEEYLEGVSIDYINQGMTGGFTIDNPNAKATCGCGASFRTATFKGTRKKCD